MIHTGQHYDPDMSEVFFEELGIRPPNYHLGIGGLPHGAMTGRMLEAVESVLLEEKPDWVLVYGDTNSTAAGALAAAKAGMRGVHVEAGLRSFNRDMPEEINRIVADHVSDLLFAPTKTAVENLRREGIPAQRVHMTGDVMYDVALFYGRKARTGEILDSWSVEPKRYAVATVHREENTDDPSRLTGIFEGLGRVAERWSVIVPLHPRTRDRLEQLRPDGLLADRMRLTGPMGYLSMTALCRGAAVILTDSGGLQKEAFFHHVPCVTLREETEWVELVEGGFNVLAGVSPAEIEAACDALLEREHNWEQSPYGDGTAAEKIVTLLTECDER